VLGRLQRPSVAQNGVQAYESGFTQYRLGYASALSFVFFLVIVAVSLLLYTATRRVGRAGR
jgi:ABC-type sugar transport system permease subunit